MEKVLKMSVKNVIKIWRTSEANIKITKAMQERDYTVTF